MKFWKQVNQRIQRLILTLLSKQWLGFFIATWLLQNECITPEVWAVAFGTVVVANVAQKVQGVSPSLPVQPNVD